MSNSNTTNLLLKKLNLIKQLAFVPIYIYQGQQLKRKAIILPEAAGDREGSVTLSQMPETTAQNIKRDDSVLTLMIVGDSSAAGVGVATQQQAMPSMLVNKLQHTPKVQNKFTQIDWTLHATTGHTSFDILRRLYVLPKPTIAIDVLIIAVGVNDTTRNISTGRWENQLKEIIAVSKRKFGAKRILFPHIPPMATMPALPFPLSDYIGAKSDKLNTTLHQLCLEHEGVDDLAIDFSTAQYNPNEMFAEDGFHPNDKTYDFWATKIADKIVSLI